MQTILLHDLGHSEGRYVIGYERMALLLGLSGSNARITFDDGYQSVFNFMSKLPQQASAFRLYIVAGKVGGVNNWDANGELTGHKLMAWEQIQELHRTGMIIGSHGLNHMDLTKATDGELEKELKESKRLIEERLNTKVESIAYPFGYFDERVIAFVKAAGYKEAYTTCDSILQGRGNPYRKGRIEITGNEPDWLVKAKVSGLYDFKAIWELPNLAAQIIKSKISRNAAGVL